MISPKKLPYERPDVYLHEIPALSVLADLSKPIDADLTIDGFEPDDNY